MLQELKEIIVHDGIRHYKINNTEILYFQTVDEYVKITDNDCMNTSILKNFCKNMIKISLEKQQFEKIINEFSKIIDKSYTLKYSNTYSSYFTIKTIDYNNKVSILFNNEYPENWIELEVMLLDYIVSEKFDYFEDYIINSLIYYVLTVKNSKEQNLRTCLEILENNEYFSKVNKFPINHPVSKMYSIIYLYINNFSDLDFYKLTRDIEFKMSQYMKKNNCVDDFLKIKSEQDVWKLVYRIIPKRSTPNYIFEYSRIMDVLENKTNTLNQKVNKLLYIFNNIIENIKVIERMVPYNKPSEYQIEDQYRNELLRPITYRKIVCYENCLNFLEENNLERAFGELEDCLDDGIGRYKKYVSINEAYIFQTLLEKIGKHINKSEEKQLQNISIDKDDINNFEDITNLIN